MQGGYFDNQSGKLRKLFFSGFVQDGFKSYRPSSYHDSNVLLIPLSKKLKWVSSGLF